MENSVLIGSALNLPLQHLVAFRTSMRWKKKKHLVEKAFLVDSGTNKDTHLFFVCANKPYFKQFHAIALFYTFRIFSYPIWQQSFLTT